MATLELGSPIDGWVRYSTVYNISQTEIAKRHLLLIKPTLAFKRRLVAQVIERALGNSKKVWLA